MPPPTPRSPGGSGPPPAESSSEAYRQPIAWGSALNPRIARMPYGHVRFLVAEVVERHPRLLLHPGCRAGRSAAAISRDEEGTALDRRTARQHASFHDSPKHGLPHDAAGWIVQEGLTRAAVRMALRCLKAAAAPRARRTPAIPSSRQPPGTPRRRPSGPIMGSGTRVKHFCIDTVQPSRAVKREMQLKSLARHVRNASQVPRNCINRLGRCLEPKLDSASSEEVLYG